MAWSRWSHSNWYICESSSGDDSDPSICVSMSATVLRSEVISDLDKCIDGILNKSGSNVSPFDKKELYLYFKIYRDYTLKEIDRESYIKKLNYLRHIGSMRRYFQERQIPNSWCMSTLISVKEKPLVIIERNGVKIRNGVGYNQRSYSGKKQEEYLGYFENGLFELTIKGDICIYQDRSLQWKELPLNKMKLLYNYFSLIEGETYEFNLKNLTIYNGNLIKDKEWIDDSLKKLDAEIEKFKEFDGNAGKSRLLNMTRERLIKVRESL